MHHSKTNFLILCMLTLTEGQGQPGPKKMPCRRQFSRNINIDNISEPIKAIGFKLIAIIDHRGCFTFMLISVTLTKGQGHGLFSKEKLCVALSQVLLDHYPQNVVIIIELDELYLHMKSGDLDRRSRSPRLGKVTSPKKL